MAYGFMVLTETSRIMLENRWRRVQSVVVLEARAILSEMQRHVSMDARDWLAALEQIMMGDSGSEKTIGCWKLISGKGHR